MKRASCDWCGILWTRTGKHTWTHTSHSPSVGWPLSVGIRVRSWLRVSHDRGMALLRDIFLEWRYIIRKSSGEREKKTKKQQSQRDFTDKYIIKASFHFSSSLMLWINMISWYTPRDILGSGNEKCYSEKCLVCSHFGWIITGKWLSSRTWT